MFWSDSVAIQRRLIAIGVNILRQTGQPSAGKIKKAAWLVVTLSLFNLLLKDYGEKNLFFFARMTQTLTIQDRSVMGDTVSRLKQR